MTSDFERILALSPHTDDVELGAGGAVAKWVEEGKEVYYAAFSTSEQSVPDGFPKNVLEKEVREATRGLGIPEDRLFLHRFEVRTFPQRRQEILETLIQLRERIKPGLVLLPSLNDMHQDHHTIAEEGVRAFKHVNLVCYEQPWNLLSFSPSLFVPLSRQHLAKKAEAIKCYRSQGNRSYADEEFIYGLARTRGVQVNTDYAEAFEVVRWILR